MKQIIEQILQTDKQIEEIEEELAILNKQRDYLAGCLIDSMMADKVKNITVQSPVDNNNKVFYIVTSPYPTVTDREALEKKTKRISVKPGKSLYSILFERSLKAQSLKKWVKEEFEKGSKIPKCLSVFFKTDIRYRNK